jgi:hypothetical protein
MRKPMGNEMRKKRRFWNYLYECYDVFLVGFRTALALKPSAEMASPTDEKPKYNNLLGALFQRDPERAHCNLTPAVLT